MECSINQALENSKDQETNKSSHQLSPIISLPFLVPQRLMSLQKPSLDRRQQYDELHSSALNAPYAPKQKIYQNVYNFLHQMVSNSEKEQVILKRFQKLEQQFETKLKKSNKSIYKMIPMTKSTSFAENEQKNNEVQMKKKSSLRPPPLLTEQNQNQKSNQSLKIIVKKSSILKQSRPLFQDLAPVNRFCTFEDKVILEPIKSENSLEEITPTQQIKIVRFNIESPQKQKKAMIQSLELSGGREVIKRPVFLYRQCSINMNEEDVEEEDKESQIFSSYGIISVEDPQLPQIHFSIQALQSIFDTPSPFFINFALCIFIKCLLKSKISLSSQNVISLLSISTLVSYKAYFDETIDGIIDHFSSLLQVSHDKIIKLESWCLHTLNFEVGVSSEQYQQIMFQLINISK